MKFQINRPSKIENRQSNIPSNIAQSANRQIVKSSNRQIISRSPRFPLPPYHLITISLFLLFSTGLYAQNEANIWYFGRHCGLDFNSGTPVLLHDGQTRSGLGCATISDSLGELLFYSDYDEVYNRDHTLMINGDNLNDPGFHGRAIINKPGSNEIYFIFTALHPQMFIGLYYSIVDMSMDNGLGAITEKEIKVESATDAADRIALVRQENSENVWLITRKFTDDAFVTYLIDQNGFNPNPTLTSMPDLHADAGTWGSLKVSYNKKYLVSSYHTRCIEVCRFNASEGKVSYLYTLDSPGGNTHNLSGTEFSPDSKFLYLSFYNVQEDSCQIYQFDMQYIESKDLFSNSGILIGIGGARDLQLARDGKIYCTKPPEEGAPSISFINVIHNPWIRGIGCMFESHAINPLPGISGWSLPNTLLDYLYRFEWEAENYCQGTPVHFLPHFVPTPDSVEWFFDEFAPGNYSNELSPTYTFQNAGIHEVEVDIWYPTGRFEHTSREIEIFPVPKPDLGPDIVFCEGISVTLNANCVADMYSWSTGQFGSPQISVSDSGTYWVRASFLETGCAGYDTIHVGFYPATTLDDSELVITPTSCSGTSGSITGLQALGPAPFIYRWEDLSEIYFGSEIDVFDLPAGQYILKITDAYGCETVSDVYTIVDAGNLQVLTVELTQPHCERPDGEIVIHAFSPSGSTLQYSINDGADYSSDSIFTGLSAGTYVVRIRDINGCEGFYIDNPISIADIPGPQVTAVDVTDETDFQGNGAIEIVATGSTPIIYYSIDSGVTWQENDGGFYNLQSGVYNLQIWDENGCDTSFTVEIQNIILTYLHAVTGEDGLCEDSAALIPVYVDNFNSVANFHLKLNYNADNLQCEGFINVHPQLLDCLTGWVDQAAGDIHLAWNSAISVTFSQQEKVADLVFSTKNPGQGELSWYTGETESYFTNVGGNLVPALFQAGEVEIYAPPEIIIFDLTKTACLGQMVSFTSFADGNQPPFEYLWTYPDGHQDDSDPFFFAVTQADAGEYILVVTDQVGCSDQQVVELIVSENPVAAFHGTDTLEMHAGDVLDAGPGLASYRWSLGDTTQSIVIQAEGMYIVEMESQLGCTGRDSIYIKLTSEEIPEFEIYVPNAFSPNGDGINDKFMISSNSLNIQHLTLNIYDRWGGELFSGDGVSAGWDGKKAGKDCPGGVYVYKIVFTADGVPGQQERVGLVMLVK